MSTWQDGNRHDVWFRRLPFPKTTAAEGGSFRGRARGRCGWAVVACIPFYSILCGCFFLWSSGKGLPSLIDGLMGVEDLQW